MSIFKVKKNHKFKLVVLIMAPRRGIEPRTNRLTETLDAEKSLYINDLSTQKSLCNCSCN